jgi:hypothetical protein
MEGPAKAGHVVQHGRSDGALAGQRRSCSPEEKFFQASLPMQQLHSGEPPSD